MPTFKSRRYGYRRRPYPRRKPFLRRTMVRRRRTQYATKRHVKHAIRKNQEVKKKNQTFQGQTTADELTVLDTMDEIEYGGGQSQRIGDKIRSIGLQIRMVVTNVTNNLLYGRFIVYSINNAGDGTSPVTSGSPIFMGPSGKYHTFADLKDSANLIWDKPNKSYLNPLYDKTFKLAEQSAREGNDTFLFKRLIKFQKDIWYNNNVAGEPFNQSKKIGFALMFYNPRTNGQPDNYVVNLDMDATMYYTDS